MKICAKTIAITPPCDYPTPTISSEQTAAEENDGRPFAEHARLQLQRGRTSYMGQARVLDGSILAH